MAKVEEVLQNKNGQLVSIQPHATVYAALELMAEKDIGALPVIENNQVLGMFSERDYARKVILKGKSSHDTAVNQLMTTAVHTINADASVEDCMALMTERHVRHLPVLKDDQPVGIISIGDVVKTIIAEQRGHIRELHDYVSGNTY